MAPDRGNNTIAYQSIRNTDQDHNSYDNEGEDSEITPHRIGEAPSMLMHRDDGGQSFTVRGVLVGLGVGLIICFSNTYFGLQTGWVSSMSMPSSLIGFAFFKTISKHLDLPFTPIENVLVQTVAGSMGTMPLGCGFVGVLPALNTMLSPEENGPIILSVWKLILWGLGLCYFGVVFAVPLRRQVIIREKLKFPSGTATALLIEVLHGKDKTEMANPFSKPNYGHVNLSAATNNAESSNSLLSNNPESPRSSSESKDNNMEAIGSGQRSSWKARVKILVISFTVSGLYTLATYFFPILRNIPIFGVSLAESWLWTLNPSLAYVGQGIIMGPSTTLHMLLGAVVGWGILSPLAKNKGWAPGPIGDWETGSKGWIVWVSLAIMLADSIISLAYITSRPLLKHGKPYIDEISRKIIDYDWRGCLYFGKSNVVYVRVVGDSDPTHLGSTMPHQDRSNFPDVTSRTVTPKNLEDDMPDEDALPENLVGDRIVWSGMVISVVFCVISIRIVFGDLIPIFATITAVLMALILSIMGVRALGETDLNPVSGISKLAQLFFALIIPKSNKNSVLINLIAGAVSEAGALQAGDLMQDLKTGHLLGAAPNAQFWGQIIGSTVGAVVSALIYKLYSTVYTIPGDLFQVPTGYVWIFTARLVTGKGLPPMAWQWALGAAVVFSITTSIRIVGNGKVWHPFVPGGIAVAVGVFPKIPEVLIHEEMTEQNISRYVQRTVFHPGTCCRGSFELLLAVILQKGRDANSCLSKWLDPWRRSAQYCKSGYGKSKRTALVKRRSNFFCITLSLSLYIYISAILLYFKSSQEWITK